MNTNEQLEEQMIVMQAQLGSDEAFERLINRYHARLTYYIRRLIGDADKSKDVLQVVWLNAHKKLPYLRHSEAFRVWLYRIAHNQSMKLLRDEKKYVQIDDSVENIIEDEQSIKLSIFDTYAIHQALDQLSPLHKEVLTLRFLEDLSYQEIADIVGTDIGTIRSRLYYAKQQMKTILQENNDER